MKHTLTALTLALGGWAAPWSASAHPPVNPPPSAGAPSAATSVSNREATPPSAEPQDASPPDLPSTDLARAWIDRDPSVQEALRRAGAAEHAGTALAAGTHEWTARATAQQRRMRDSGDRSQEWNVGLEHGVRLGRKAGLDRQLGNNETELARVQWLDARHQAGLALADLWLGHRAAVHAQTLAQEQVELAQTQLAAVQKRKRAGDASLLELNAAEADLADVRRQASQATTQVRKAELRLRQRFPDLTLPPVAPLSEPQPPQGTLEQWQTRVVEVSEEIHLAQLRVDQADLVARRASADRLPDPVLGVYTAQEAFRTERLIGVSISVPLGGARRSAVERQRLQELDAQRHALERLRRESDANVAEAHTDAIDGTQRWTLAQSAARSAVETARLTRRAYELGEGDLQAVLLSQRQAREATRTALEARTEALRAHHRLLIDAHQIWASALDP